jgi:hypothetical protein
MMANYHHGTTIQSTAENSPTTTQIDQNPTPVLPVKNPGWKRQ